MSLSHQTFNIDYLFINKFYLPVHGNQTFLNSFVLWRHHVSAPLRATNVIYTWMKKHCRLKGINLERWGFKDSYSFKANSKVFQQKFTLSQAAHVDANPKGTLFKECHCLSMSPKKAFRSYRMIFKCKDLWCALYRWNCGLISKKTGNHQTFFGICEKHW